AALPACPFPTRGDLAPSAYCTRQAAPGRLVLFPGQEPASRGQGPAGQAGLFSVACPSTTMETADAVRSRKGDATELPGRVRRLPQHPARAGLAWPVRARQPSRPRGPLLKIAPPAHYGGVSARQVSGGGVLPVARVGTDRSAPKCAARSSHARQPGPRLFPPWRARHFDTGLVTQIWRKARGPAAVFSASPVGALVTRKKARCPAPGRKRPAGKRGSAATCFLRAAALASVIDQ
ncbi:unnamed protein product, partial [Amoebophrya sp. A120]